MTDPIQPGPLSEEEFDRLDDILSVNEDRGLTVEGLDGFFAALVCSPMVARPSEWMPVVWGGEAPAWATVDEAQEAVGLLMRMWNQVAESIDDGSFSPLMTSGTDHEGNEVTLPHPWCMGFVEGMRMHRGPWFDESNEELQELTLPIALIAWDAAVMLGEVPESEERLTDEKLSEYTDLIPDVVQALRAYWMEHPVIMPLTPEGIPKLGRTDPCPCGSGKTFKNCHGASLQ
jgi:uncharacterized protein